MKQHQTLPPSSSHVAGQKNVLLPSLFQHIPFRDAITGSLANVPLLLQMRQGFPVLLEIPSGRLPRFPLCLPEQGQRLASQQP